jgi:hypothetical protein
VILFPRAWQAHLQRMIAGGNVRGKCIVIFVGPHGAIGSFSHFHCLLLTIMPLRPFTGAESTIWLCARVMFDVSLSCCLIFAQKRQVSFSHLSAACFCSIFHHDSSNLTLTCSSLLKICFFANSSLPGSVQMDEGPHGKRITPEKEPFRHDWLSSFGRLQHSVLASKQPLKATLRRLYGVVLLFRRNPFSIRSFVHLYRPW